MENDPGEKKPNPLGMSPKKVLPAARGGPNRGKGPRQTGAIAMILGKEVGRVGKV